MTTETAYDLKDYFCPLCMYVHERGQVKFFILNCLEQLLLCGYDTNYLAAVPPTTN